MLVALLVALFALQGSNVPKPDEPAPALTVGRLLQAPKGASATWDALRGKAVVLEFWATWCGPCVENIPHLNALAEKFKGRPIQFISITDEEQAIITHFLEKHPIAGWVALDPEEGTFIRYGIEARPQTILVDDRGVLRAITSPQGLTEGVLEDLLAGKELKITQPLGSPLIGLEPSAPTPLIQVLIRPAAPIATTRMSPGARRRTGGRIELWGLTLRDLLSSTYGIPAEQIEAPEWCSRTRYDLAVVTPKGDDSEGRPLVQQVLATTFRLKLRREMRETEVYVLRKLPGREPSLRSATTLAHSSWKNKGGIVGAIGMPIAQLVWAATGVLGRPVFDETGLKGRYDFDLRWDEKDPASFVKAFREQLGLELTSVRRSLEFLVVESAEEPLTW